MIAATAGRPLTVFKGKGKPPDQAKTLSVGRILGAYALTCWAAAEVIWKVEGLSDLLALHHLAAGLLGQHVVGSNSQGILETIKADWPDLFAGKRVHIVHDAARAGPGRPCGPTLWPGGRPRSARSPALRGPGEPRRGPTGLPEPGRPAGGRTAPVG